MPPTAERTLNPARTFLERLDHRPGSREQPGQLRHGRTTSAKGQKQFIPVCVGSRQQMPTSSCKLDNNQADRTRMSLGQLSNAPYTRFFSVFRILMRCEGA